MSEIVLTGLRPEPLARYLGALGILRLVSEQVDPTAHAWWSDAGFVLQSTLADADALLRFFLEDYRPTPVAAPWNGGSGFYPKDNTEGLDAILTSEHPRFADYRELLSCVRYVLDLRKLTSKPDKQAKSELIGDLRAELPDASLAWLDAALVLTNEGERYPPLLGTGGNDGRLEFSTNFMKRLAELLLGKESPEPSLLRACLFDEPALGMAKMPIGQFLPAQAGGPNMTAGFDGEAQINPWTYVLAVEGAMIPTGAATRRLESNRGPSPAFPFTARAATVGYASAGNEESRDELWMPVWTMPCSHAEIRHLFAEGRAKVPSAPGGRREAVDGVDFARAISTLGVDRGIGSFTRYGLHQRNGLSYFAVPLGRWYVRESKAADLLAQIDPWLHALRQRADKLPSLLASAARRVEIRLMDACRRDDTSSVLDLLVSLGEVEALAARGKERLLEPLPPLSSEWLTMSQDGSPELRLAACLASSGIRRRVSPAMWIGERGWMWAPDADQVTWVDSANFVANLVAVALRRDLDRQREIAGSDRFADAAACGIRDNQKFGKPRRWPTFSDICMFIDDALDEQRLEALTRGLMLIDWPRVAAEQAPRDRDTPVPASFALLLLARELELDPPLARTPGLLTNAAAGNMRGASTLAVRRLAGAGRRFPRSPLHEPGQRTRRMAAALAFPFATSQLQILERQLFPRLQDLSIKDTTP